MQFSFKLHDSKSLERGRLCLNLIPLTTALIFLRESVTYFIRIVPVFVILTASILMNENASERLLQIRY